ncbi:MAG: glycosyltransferase [Actinobacteria bacterium]|uniref:Unannotated protein n=1 Tax=freshwater metagenome TaxID=449393 RepID=A0A6J6SJ11_9ZZZZ|nr:glycosyltransferase [Actinomycetota bacterium]MSW78539.1 glycosyltransferase [Actinomycetota bacterium]MSX54162.1 glycosyltransferase [Actinomycetota bacterium]MSX92377.1 glycosyltransferase [Actinomycetota bacterium]MSZ83858.1 glycosyltransferase [Actinomycetota bacterium]
MIRAVVGGTADALLEALRADVPHGDAAVLWTTVPCDDSLLAAAAEAALVGTVSPMPVADASAALVTYELHAALPPAPLLPRPCASVVLFSAEAVELLRRDLPATATDAATLIADLGARLTRLGYQHVAAPGVALRWSPIDGTGNVPATDYDRALDSSANSSLAAHRLWAATRLRPIRVVLDGACMTGDVHTGTQRVVLEVSRSLAATRAGAQVAVAVGAEFVASTREAMRGSGVDVVERSASATPFDVVYRPYQMLRAQELRWCHDVADRMLVSQLDMIGFSNPTYHPSSDLFFLARNLQRTMMLQADGVTFISEFGRRSAMTEVAELDEARTTVVSCGSDTEPLPGTRPAAAPDAPFVLVLSATFTHKNRGQAIAAFADAVQRHGIEGNLLVAGPEPFYGRSTDDDARLVQSFGTDVARRVVHLGQVSDAEKWWLLRNASAVLYPSTVEGFGLIPFEAASVDTPCLAFRGTALGEILGEGPATIVGWRASDWADALAGVMTDPAAAAAALAHVRDAAHRHTWQESARLTWQAIDGAIAMPARVRVAHEGSFAAAVQPTRRVAPFIAARAFYLRLGPFLQRRLRRLLRR